MQLGLGGVLFVVFVILKLCHIIAWSWWWVTAPLWIGFALFLVMLVLFGGAAALFMRSDRRRPAARW